jgi:hypothetical protein
LCASEPGSPSPAGAAPDLAAPAVQLDLPPIVVSYELSQIVKLADAGISDPVLLAYVDNSRYFPPPTADELLYLRAHKVSPEVCAAIIKRGSELQQWAAKAAQPRQTPPPAYAEQPAPTAVVAAPPTVTYVESPTPVYAYSYPATVYGGYPAYGYGYGYAQPFFGVGIWYSGTRNNCWRPYPATYPNYHGAGYRGGGPAFRAGVGAGSGSHGAPMRGGFGGSSGPHGGPQGARPGGRHG